MKRLTTLLMTLMLMSAALWADETITVSANSSDISEGLDLKVVAKLFAEAKNLEEFEMMLNNPDSAFCNLDLNGDGQVDYLRVVETGEGNKRLIVLQAILAKDIYQDVASIYVEKDENNQVSVQVIGDEYIYGTNYIIEPVYVYRPVIYDWFWSPYWYAWNSPWYWGYWPGWWHAHACWAHDWYWHHCYAFHHHHHYCSFRPGRVYRTGYQELRTGVTRRDFAVAHPERSFSQRNVGKTNAREIRNTTGVQTRQAFASGEGSSRQMNSGSARQGIASREATNTSRTYGSRTTATTRVDREASAQRSSATAQRSSATAQRSSATAQRSSATSQRSSATAQRSSTTSQRASSSASISRSSSAYRSSSYSGSSSNSSSRSSGGYSSGSSSRSSGGYSSSSSSRSSGGYSSGSSSRSSGGYSSGGGSRSSGGSSGATRR
ncbi:MAG: hypothetical protein IJS82_04955 [Paludibacteraceae bacterium]|nr:hypothetical protein [Paludibacteraceae bacterium]